MNSYCQVCLRIPLKKFEITNGLRLFFVKILDIKLKKDSALCFECCGLSMKFLRFYKKCFTNMKLLEEHCTNSEIMPNQITSLQNVDNSFVCQRFSLVQISIEFAEIFKSVKNEKEEIILSETPVKNEEFDSDDEIPLAVNNLDVVKLEKFEAETELRQRTGKLKEGNERTKNKKLSIGFTESYAKILHLNFEDQTAEMTRRSLSLNYLNSPHRCELCFRGFLSSAKYEKHKTRHDERSGSEVCKICSLRYTSLRSLRAHALHAHERRFQCNRCGQRLHTANQARDHEKWHKGFLYECQFCAEKFRKPTSRLTHMRKLHPSLHSCSECGENFVSPKGLQMHAAKSHNSKMVEGNVKDDRWLCATCEVHFESENAYRRHFLTSAKHPGEYRFSCKICFEKHQNNSELREHVRKKHSNPTSANLQPQAVAEPRATVTCDLCGVCFDSKAKCRIHIKRTHLGVKYARDIVCEQCGRKYSSNSALRIHQRSHTGDRPYPCNECSKTFRNLHQLKIHIRLHTGDKPYSCTECDKKFRQKPALNRHTRVHSGVKPYKCEHCDKCFSQSNSLKIHTLSIHFKYKDKSF